VPTLIASLPLPAPAFASLTYPRFRQLLEIGDATRGNGIPGGRLVAIGASEAGFPVGLALGVVGKAGEARLLSIFVSKAWRRRGIGNRLCVQACGRMGEWGAESVHIQYSTRVADPVGLAAFFQHAGWPPPEPLEFRLAGRADWVVRAGPDYARFLQSVESRGFDATPWSEIDGEDRAEVARLVPHINHPNLDPALWDARSDPALNLALRQGRRLIGWVLSENQLAHGYIHHVCGFVGAEFQRQGWLLAGLFRVCERQCSVYGPQSIAVYETPSSNHRMVRMMKERLAPFTEWTDERLTAARAVSVTRGEGT